MMNNQPVTIYISAAPNLMAEREALARMIADLPVSLPWHIVQTPAEAEPIDRQALLKANLYFLIMEADIRAPVGLELHTAQRAGRPIMAFAKQDAVYTPAGQVFIRQANVNWQPFSNAVNLSRQVQRIITQHLLLRAIEYTLTPVEVANLEHILQSSPQPKSEQKTQGEGIGHSAVLLSPERYTPSEGVIIDEP